MHRPVAEWNIRPKKKERFSGQRFDVLRSPHTVRRIAALCAKVDGEPQLLMKIQRLIVWLLGKKDLYRQGNMKKKQLCMRAPPARLQMDRYSGSGPPTCPPSQVFPSGFSSPDGEERAFVPITAAGQRGLFTPLPHIHSFRKFGVIIDGVRSLCQPANRFLILIPPKGDATSTFKCNKMGTCLILSNGKSRRNHRLHP